MFPPRPAVVPPSTVNNCAWVAINDGKTRNLPFMRCHVFHLLILIFSKNFFSSPFNSLSLSLSSAADTHADLRTHPAYRLLDDTAPPPWEGTQSKSPLERGIPAASGRGVFASTLPTSFKHDCIEAAYSAFRPLADPRKIPRMKPHGHSKTDN